jgi:hypothetical protein
VSVSTKRPDPDEIPLPPIAQKDGNALVLRFRTPAEACLIRKELEKEDIVVLLPDPEELLSEYRRNGYVEARVSARAYAAAGELKSSVEFQYKQLRSELPLNWGSKIAALLCAGIPLPGVGVFVWLLSSYREHGYDRRAEEFKRWYLLGLAVYVVIFVGAVIL